MPRKKAEPATPAEPVRKVRKRSPKKAETPEEREKQLTNLAMNLAEKQLREGTASSSVITHFLKLGSTREAIEKEALEAQKTLVTAKASSIVSHSDSEKKAEEALGAFRKYQGTDEHDDDR